MRETEFEAVAAAILAMFPPLAGLEQRAALTLYRLLATGGPVSHDALAAECGMARVETARMVTRWPDVQRDDNARVTGYGGLTLNKTKHRLRIGREVRYTWCAWDTLFLPQLLGDTAEVESTCPVTGARIVLTVRPDAVEAHGIPPPVSLVGPESEEAAADLVGQFCCHVHFFATHDAGRDWVTKRPGTYLASLEQAWELGRRRNAQRYPMVHA